MSVLSDLIPFFASAKSQSLQSMASQCALIPISGSKPSCDSQVRFYPGKPEASEILSLSDPSDHSKPVLSSIGRPQFQQLHFYICSAGEIFKDLETTDTIETENRKFKDLTKFQASKLIRKVSPTHDQKIMEERILLNRKSIYGCRGNFWAWRSAEWLVYVFYLKAVNNYKISAAEVLDFGQLLRTKTVNMLKQPDAGLSQADHHRYHELDGEVNAMEEVDREEVQASIKVSNRQSILYAVWRSHFAVKALKSVVHRDALQEHLDAECEVLVGLKVCTKQNYQDLWSEYQLSAFALDLHAHLATDSLTDLKYLLEVPKQTPIWDDQLEACVGLLPGHDQFSFLKIERLKASTVGLLEFSLDLPVEFTMICSDLLFFYMRFVSLLEPDAWQHDLVKSDSVELYFTLKARKLEANRELLEACLAAAIYNVGVTSQETLRRSVMPHFKMSIEDFPTSRASYLRLTSDSCTGTQPGADYLG